MSYLSIQEAKQVEDNAKKENEDEKGPTKAAEAKFVALFAQYPPIEKMDASLSTLGNCEYVRMNYLLNIHSVNV